MTLHFAFRESRLKPAWLGAADHFDDFNWIKSHTKAGLVYVIGGRVLRFSGALPPPHQHELAQSVRASIITIDIWWYEKFTVASLVCLVPSCHVYVRAKFLAAESQAEIRASSLRASYHIVYQSILLFVQLTCCAHKILPQCSALHYLLLLHVKAAKQIFNF